MHTDFRRKPVLSFRFHFHILTHRLSLPTARLPRMTEETPEVIDIQPQQLASVQARLGSFLLDVALMVVTLFVG